MSAGGAGCSARETTHKLCREKHVMASRAQLQQPNKKNGSSEYCPGIKRLYVAMKVGSKVWHYGDSPS
jgi:hypothetical protein